MKCSKCGHEIKVNDEVRFCYFCGAPQEQETPLSETGSALRKIYNDFGHEKIFENPRYITSALGDFIPDADIISTSIELVYRAGLGKVYESQVCKGENPDTAFYSRVKKIITEDVGFSEKKADQLISYFDEMIGWEKVENAETVISSHPQEYDIDDHSKDTIEEKTGLPLDETDPLLFDSLANSLTYNIATDDFVELPESDSLEDNEIETINDSDSEDELPFIPPKKGMSDQQDLSDDVSDSVDDTENKLGGVQKLAIALFFLVLISLVLVVLYKFIVWLVYRIF